MAHTRAAPLIPPSFTLQTLSFSFLSSQQALCTEARTLDSGIKETCSTVLIKLIVP